MKFTEKLRIAINERFTESQIQSMIYNKYHSPFEIKAYDLPKNKRDMPEFSMQSYLGRGKISTEIMYKSDIIYTIYKREVYTWKDRWFIPEQQGIDFDIFVKRFEKEF